MKYKAGYDDLGVLHVLERRDRDGAEDWDSVCGTYNARSDDGPWEVHTVHDIDLDDCRYYPVSAWRWEPKDPPITRHDGSVFNGYLMPAGGGRCPDCPWDQVGERLLHPTLDALHDALQDAQDSPNVFGFDDYHGVARELVIALEERGWTLVGPTA